MTQRHATLGGKKLSDPRILLEGTNRNRTPADFWQKANGYSCPIGKEPGKAYVLLSRRNLVALARNNLHSLVWNHEGGATTFVNLVIVRADCMTLSHNSDPDATYLVELADCRQQLKLSAINSQYNIRIPAPPASTGTSLCYPDSLNAGAFWTWQTMLSDIWDKLPAVAGAAPTLPYTPNGTPEGFRFIGVSAWDALHVVLDKIGVAVKYNPLTGEFSYIRKGATQTGLAAALTAISGRQVYNYDPLDSARADSPATVRVFFHKISFDGHGSERDTPRTDNWEMNAVHSEDVATGITGAETGTVLPVWDDMPAIVDETDTLTNSSDLATRAAEIAANIAAQYQSPFRTHYGGCITTILPGSEVSRVVWRDYSDGAGLVTEIHREAVARECCGLMVAGEGIAPPDLGRQTHPVYPDLAQVVQVYHSAGTQGERVEANADGFHPGRVRLWVASALDVLEDCWIRFVDDHDNLDGDVPVIDGECFAAARLSGVDTSGGSTKPIYLVRAGASERIARFELTATLALSGDAAAVLLEDDGADWTNSADAIQVYDLHTTEGMWAGISGYRGWAVRIAGEHASGRPRYGILWMEQIAQTIQFTTTEYMGASTAGRVAVTVDWYDHQGKDPGSVIARDPQGEFPDVHSGAKGTAVYDYHNGYYRIVSCQRVALFASALLTANSCASSMSIDNFAVKATGDYVGAPPTTPTAPTNTCGHAGLDNDTVLLRRTNNTLPNPGWEVIDVTLHLVKPITTVEISGGNLQYKTKDIYTEQCSTAESSATTISGTTTTCP